MTYLMPILLLNALLTAPPVPRLSVWYGRVQSYPHGSSQRCVNVLGTISEPAQVRSVSYSLNGSISQRLNLGSDLHRLARPGDFNIDLDTVFLRNGANHVQIRAQTQAGWVINQTITIWYTKNARWPLPYEVDWKRVRRIQDAVQIIDGEWVRVPGGIRTATPYYDRVVGFGDARWQNYEVQTSVTFHGFTLPTDGPPTYNVSHAAIATYWPGPDPDTLQPHRKWFPLGATAELYALQRPRQLPLPYFRW
jgi:hypothetical protein